MDITQWLEDTAAAGRPKQPTAIAHLSEPLAVSAAATNPVVHPSKRKIRTRRRSGANSSILAPEGTLSEVSAETTVKRKFTAVIPISPLSKSATSGASGINIVDSGLYLRKKRRKIHADKYDLKPERSRHTRRKSECHDKERKKATKSNKRNKKRVSSEKTAAAIVRSFNAPNVDRGRLTLQHAPNPGLFKKGRASSPFKGRGLPDLVFSEMNFLQKRKGLHDAAIPAETGTARRIKDRARQMEEEISAYFVPSRPPLKEQDLNSLSEKRHYPLAHKDQSRLDVPRYAVSADSFTRPSIEPIEESVTASRPGRSKSASATYLSWSTSAAPGPAFHKASSCDENNVLPLHTQLHKAPTRHEERRPSPCRRCSSKNHDLASKQLQQKKKLISKNPLNDHQKAAETAKPMTNMREQKKKLKKGPIEQKPTVVLPQNRPTTTESLPLPSTPPRFVLQHSSPQEFDTGKMSKSPSILHILDMDTKRPQRSSSSLGKLLKDCDACFERTSSRRALEDLPKLTLKEDSLGSGFIDANAAQPTFGHVVNEYPKDVRRIWRVHDEDSMPARPVDEVEVAHEPRFFDILMPYDEIAVETYAGRVSVGEGTSYGDQDTEENNFIFDGLEEETASLQEEVANKEDLREDDEFHNFWRPNILY